MPFRVDSRATVPLTDDQHDIVSDAVKAWAATIPNANATGINENPEAGKTEIVVYVDSLAHDQMAPMMGQIKNGIESLPESSAWPDPTLNASPSQYEE